MVTMVAQCHRGDYMTQLQNWRGTSFRMVTREVAYCSLRAQFLGHFRGESVWDINLSRFRRALQLKCRAGNNWPIFGYQAKSLAGQSNFMCIN